MRSILSVVSFLCVIIGGFLIISIPFVGLFKVGELFPAWFYIVVFLGIVIPYMLKEDVNDNSQQNAEQPKIMASSSNLQQPTKADNIQYKNIEGVIDLDSISAIMSLYPYITPADDKGSIIGLVENTQGGFIRLCQQKKRFDPPSGKVEILYSRIAYLTGSLEDLNGLIERHRLQIGSQLKGKIILVESLMPSWKGHGAKVDDRGNTVGYRFNDRFYPVYAKYVFVDDINASDNVMNFYKAKYFFRDYDLRPGDMLPIAF
jgi:hypothetical protein